MSEDQKDETIEQAAAAAAKPPEDQPEQPPQRIYQPCPCGNVPERLLLEISHENKVGRATGDCCGTWGVEFLRGHATEPEVILDKAQAAWDTAPRT